MGTSFISLFLPFDESPFDKQGWASPAMPPRTSVGPATLQTTTEVELLAQIPMLQQDMVKMQEHNKILSSKVDETQK